jgi:hypothetical protein
MVKKTLPILSRYLLVVTIACALAFYISQSKTTFGRASVSYVQHR